VALLAACGIPTDGEPRLLADETTTTSGPAVAPAGNPTARVYLVGPSSQVVARSRGLEGSRTPSSVLDALLAPLSEAETSAGLTTNIPPGTTATVDVDGSTAVLDMSGEWGELADPGATTAYAQVVLTLTELDGVEQVRFLIEGAPRAAPTVNQGQRDVVSESDYIDLDPDG